MDMQKIPFMDLRIHDLKERDRLLKSFERLMDHGRYIMGHEVEDFEDKVAKYCQRKYCIGVSSGTDALYLALKSLGIGPGDEVITTSFSWIATANAIVMTGATPVFADINDNLNISVESLERLITQNTKAILPVHYTGRPVEISRISEIVKGKGIHVIYDAAQAFGSQYKDKPVGSYGDMCCFSMNPMKVLGACGEAGAIVTDDVKVYETLKVLRYNGTINKEFCLMPSLNGRIDALQAAILSDRLDFLADKINKRKTICKYYDELLAGMTSIPEQDTGDSISSYYSYTIQVNDRQKLIDDLSAAGIETKIQHPILMCDQEPYKKFRNDANKKTREIVSKIICLPANENIKKSQVEYISAVIKQSIDN